MAEPKKKSLFAQRMVAQRAGQSSTPASSKLPQDKLQEAFGSKSYIVTSEDANRIHHDNIMKLSNMTNDEIEEERNKLLSNLDSGVLAFLRSRRKFDSTQNPGEVMETENINRDDHPSSTAADSMVPVTEQKDIVEPKIEELPDLSEFAQKYPHMDVIEGEKLQWIGDLPKDKPHPTDPFPARFDFEGVLLPYIDKGEGVLKGLHNHGEEQERPGYTIQELLQLSRSAVLQQRVIALTSLSNIMAKASQYQEAFCEPIHPVLLDADVYLLLRFSLDDPSQRVVMASAGAICNLIVNHTDEVCLDLMMGSPMGLQQPSLGVVIDMKQSEIDELKDTELLKLDIIRGMMRTNILERVRYILDKLQIEPIETKQMLKTLVRMSRHSFEMANAVFSMPHLLDIVFSKLLVDNTSKQFYPEALKLFRVISARSKTLAENILKKYDLVNFLFNFIAGDKAQGHPEAMHLALESFYTWQTFLNYDLGLESFRALIPVLGKLLAMHLEYTGLSSSGSDLEHASAVITTISSVAKVHQDSVMPILSLACQCGLKWINQYSEIDRPSLSASKLVGAVLQLFTLTHSTFDCSNLEHAVENIFKRKALSRSLQQLRKCSWLICGKTVSNIESLPCLGSVPPTLLPDSTLPFVYSLTNFLLTTKNKKLRNSFIKEEELFLYLNRVVESDSFRSLSGHWFARQELCLLVSIVHLYSSCEEGENHRFIHQLAFALMTVVQEGDKYLLADLISDVVFNRKFFQLEVDDINERLHALTLLEEDSHSCIPGKRAVLQIALESMPDIEALYLRELGMTHLRPTWPPPTLTGLLNSTQPAFPSDWIFIPIIRLHQCEGRDKNAETAVSATLKWFIIIEEFSSHLLSYIRPSAKYCRLSCVYLAGPDLFRNVGQLLSIALSYVTDSYRNLDFNDAIPGLSSFYDFFRELLEQYAGVSYCDPVFCRYILVPLAQKHDVKYKKIVWSELAYILRLIRSSPSEVNMEHYLTPTETDSNMLMTYLRAVATGVVKEEWCPILYRMAFHHVASYAASNSDELSTVLRDRIGKLGNAKLKSEFVQFLEQS
ncbi:RPAP1-like, N-terminal [Nesidiocoris tenuis]|uniref:RPAP1-like, N-terminal n=1 Tax=Nesidiocoris tenuis TaxID=355587 RepID=A0ABN7AER2_9HEMI|nr:RPAP1-like, N-terminal [Nesidiocoris tenuis]